MWVVYPGHDLGEGDEDAGQRSAGLSLHLRPGSGSRSGQDNSSCLVPRGRHWRLPLTSQMPARAPCWRLESGEVGRADASEGEPSRPTPHRGGDKGTKMGFVEILRLPQSRVLPCPMACPQFPLGVGEPCWGQRVRRGPHHDPAGAASDLQPALMPRQHRARRRTRGHPSRDQPPTSSACFSECHCILGSVQYNIMRRWTPPSE